MDNFNNQQPVAPQPVAPQPGNDAKTQSIVALVLGIVAASLGVFGWVLSAIPVWGLVLEVLVLGASIAAIIFGVKARNAAKAAGQSMAMATVGMILGIVFVVFGGIGMICGACTTCALCTAGSATGLADALNNIDWSSLQ